MFCNEKRRIYTFFLFLTQNNLNVKGKYSLDNDIIFDIKFEKRSGMINERWCVPIFVGYKVEFFFTAKVLSPNMPIVRNICLAIKMS